MRRPSVALLCLLSVCAAVAGCRSDGDPGPAPRAMQPASPFPPADGGPPLLPPAAATFGTRLRGGTSELLHAARSPFQRVSALRELPRLRPVPDAAQLPAPEPQLPRTLSVPAL